MAFSETVGGKAFLRNLWVENPVFRQLLGICSTLAVTNLLVNTALMCGGLMFTAALNYLIHTYLTATLGIEFMVSF